MQGEQFGNYKFLSILGEGGMAVVYLAENTLLGKRVAIKLLRQEFVHNSNIRIRFLAEARSMVQVSHANIISVLDLIDAGDIVAIVMEYVDGKSLKEYLMQKGHLDDSEILTLFTQILTALQHVHDSGYVHRDIKPSNFILSGIGKIKLADFGIAKDLNKSHEMTHTGMNMGTPIYMSPEQVKSTRDVDHRSDIYSLGIVLYEMVTGTFPYDKHNLSLPEIQVCILRDQLPSTGTIWDNQISMATIKNEKDRYQSCEEWLKDLKAISNVKDLSDVKQTSKSEHTANDKTKADETIQSAKKVEIKSTNNEKAKNAVPQSSGAALVSLITGIIGLFLSWIPFLGFFLGLLSIILGAVGQKDKQKLPSTNKSSGIAGIVLGSVTVIIGIIFIFLFFIGLAAANEDNNLVSSDNAPKTNPKEINYQEQPNLEDQKEVIRNFYYDFDHAFDYSSMKSFVNRYYSPKFPNNSMKNDELKSFKSYDIKEHSIIKIDLLEETSYSRKFSILFYFNFEARNGTRGYNKCRDDITLDNRNQIIARKQHGIIQ